MDVKVLKKKIDRVIENIEKVVRGKREVVELACVSLFVEGHLLIEDVPGVGKTTLAHSLARSVDATFRRIQFTSDLMPSDVIGVTIYNEVTGDFEFRHGPIFANIVLADEINRATPKTQSALLEAMNERQVSVDNITYPLPEPFMLIATQNPVEYTGTFMLPESQLDRFTISVTIGYPQEEVEKEIISSPPSALMPETLEPAITVDELISIQHATEKVRIEEDLLDYIMSIVKKTREHELLRLGVSPRGARAFYRCAQAMALIRGRDWCTPDDIKAVAVPALAHRVIPREYEQRDSSRLIIEEIVESTTVPV
ncbi:MAG TPA: MoxR family ATPase [Deltaproteobacteria bacterium]|nr:MoxR family ATPase [Deltaproteobacteria bacterium]